MGAGRHPRRRGRPRSCVADGGWRRVLRRPSREHPRHPDGGRIGTAVRRRSGRRHSLSRGRPPLLGRGAAVVPCALVRVCTFGYFPARPRRVTVGPRSLRRRGSTSGSGSASRRSFPIWSSSSTARSARPGRCAGPWWRWRSRASVTRRARAATSTSISPPGGVCTRPSRRRSSTPISRPRRPRRRRARPRRTRPGAARRARGMPARPGRPGRRAGR